MTAETKAALANIQNLITKEIKKVTGAETEVTITKNEVLVYTEEMNKEWEISAFMTAAREQTDRRYYEADEDCPEGLTLVFAA